MVSVLHLSQLPSEKELVALDPANKPPLTAVVFCLRTADYAQGKRISRGSFNLFIPSLKKHAHNFLPAHAHRAYFFASIHTQRTMIFAFCILHFAFCILHFAFCILHFAFCILHFAFCILHFAFCISEKWILSHMARIFFCN